MPLPTADIKVGKCYKTPNNQHRRVVKITDDDYVIYEDWGGNVGHTGGHLHQTKAKIGTFAKAVDAIIPCPGNLPPMPVLP